jgi:enamine deaminase RidA (YjgF/YER057c/UK114 family)
MDQIVRHQRDGFRIVEVDRGFWVEIYVSGFFAGTDVLTDNQVSTIGGILNENSAAHISLFGGNAAMPEALASKLRCKDLGIDRFEQPENGAAPFVSLGALILQPKKSDGLQTMKFDDGSRGWVMEAPGVRMGYLSGVKSPNASRTVAFRETYEQTIQRLIKMGFSPTDLTRTWCYFRDMLVQYREFNEIRKELLDRYGLLNSMLPASTGIQGVIDTGEHLTMHALAFAGSKVERGRVMNPNQREAPKYGSFFSRAIEVKGLGPSQLIVSGLAAIGEKGETLHVGSPLEQVDDTIKNARKLLDEAGYDWKDCVSMIAYIKPGYYQEISEKLSATILDEIPSIRAMADVCRDDLLFEIEFMAFRGGNP